jgi:toxin-antitoxin system PIN domain toxin
VSRVALLDVSVLVALFKAGHTHHQAAHDWLADHVEFGWASCPITENGLLRVLGNPSRADPFMPLAELVQRLKTFCDSAGHQFWSDSISLSDSALFNTSAFRGHQQLTDVYLLGLAVKRGGRFVTFDRSIPLAAVKGATRVSLEVIAGGKSEV